MNTVLGIVVAVFIAELVGIHRFNDIVLAALQTQVFHDIKADTRKGGACVGTDGMGLGASVNLNSKDRFNDIRLSGFQMQYAFIGISAPSVA